MKETCSGLTIPLVRRATVRTVSAFYPMPSAPERPVVGISGDRIRQCLVGLVELLKEGVSPPVVGMHAPAEAAVGSFDLHRGGGRWQAQQLVMRTAGHRFNYAMTVNFGLRRTNSPDGSVDGVAYYLRICGYARSQPVAPYSS